mgnify:FL=1|tara:strand:- start:254 stop:586 length:333 start_codon:yes stop_codon:yes gene_type:complete
MEIYWKKLLSPETIAKLTYGNDASRFNGLNIIIKEVNDVSERWVDFIKDNFTPKSQIDKERKEALEALLHVITDIEMLRTDTWEPDNDSCDATTDNLKLVIKYIEKTKGV